MDEQWIGKAVDLNCGPIGVFQGVIDAVHLEQQTITIKNVIHNGVPSKMSSVTIEARDIKNIEFVETSAGVTSHNRKQATSTITTAAKKKTRPVAESLALNSNGKSAPSPMGNQAVFELRTSPKKAFESYNQRATPKQRHYQRDEDCFDNIDMGKIHMKEFDFEGNLALFDKQRVLEEIESNQPDVVRLIDHNRRGGSSKAKVVVTPVVAQKQQQQQQPKGADGELKYRNDQNVLVSEPAQFRLIQTADPPVGEYVTESGLVVPAISYQLRERFMAAAEAKGISRERLVELVARTGTEVAIQLLGGSRRLNPANSHQIPLCVILCGPGRTGEYGLAISRHLATQGAKTVAFFPQLELYQRNLATEIALYKLCCKSSSSKLINDVKDLPLGAVDLVVMAMDDHDYWSQERAQPWHRGAIRWCRDLRAPVLAVDPLASPLSPPLPYKASVVPGLPLWHEGGEVGKIYMVNLAVPSKVYKDVGIVYHPPFGAKSYVTLDSAC